MKPNPKVLVQTRVPEKIAKWMAHAAESDGDTIAGWLRRFLIQAHEAERRETKEDGR